VSPRFAIWIAPAILLAGPSAARAYCPSYTPAETADGGHLCAIDPVDGHNPDIPTWQAIFLKVAPGAASIGSDGPPLATIKCGCGKPAPATDVEAHFPCHVLKAIAIHESGWRQFCLPDSPPMSVGAPERTLISFDCGYGVAQVTSGMHVGQTPAFDRQRVAGDPTYNLAVGASILRQKWAGTSCVGDRNPDIVEDWYTSLWAYNGIAYSNNPNNPNLTAGRGVYNPANGGSYTYQERVLGWMEHPPAGRWTVLAAAYPNRGDVGTTGAPPALPEPSCASPTDCTQTRSTHGSSCGGEPLDAGVPDAGAAPDGGAADAGIPDAGEMAADGGGPGPSPPGGSCEAVGAPSLLGVAWVVALLLRRRRSRSK
jgi:hypothetical protein